jgi:hypothetical protein
MVNIPLFIGFDGKHPIILLGKKPSLKLVVDWISLAHPQYVNPKTIQN